LLASALLLALRVASRGDEFYDLQRALFLGMLLQGGLWLAPRLSWLRQPALRHVASFFAKTSYPLYLSHNVLIGWLIANMGSQLTWLELVGVAISCHACAYVFWWTFDRHYKAVALWLRQLTTLTRRRRKLSEQWLDADGAINRR
jgi:hypothetical protein